MNKNIVLFSTLVFLLVQTFAAVGAEPPSWSSGSSRGSTSKSSVLPPNWTIGIKVKNSTKKDIKVIADGGPVKDYTTIGAGTEKMIESTGDEKRGIKYLVDGDPVAKVTSKYDKPYLIDIKSDKTYDAWAMDKTESKGSWTSLKASTYYNQQAIPAQ